MKKNDNYENESNRVDRVRDLSGIISLLGISLVFSPIYFFVVDLYQEDVYFFWFKTLGDQSWGLVGIFLVFLGLVLLSFGLPIKGKISNKIIQRLSALIIILIFTFGTWIFDLGIVAYFGVIGYVVIATLTMEVTIMLFKEAIGIYKKLESYEKLTILIPLITLIINVIWR